MLCRVARWQRVKTPKSFFEITIGMVVAAVLFVVVFVVDAMGRPFSALSVGFVTLVLLMLALTVRVNRMGVFYSDVGVRSRSHLRTRTITWASIEKFEDRPASNTWVPGTNAPARGIWIVRWDGETIQTPLIYPIAQFISDEFTDPPTHRRRWTWTVHECHAALEQLNTELERARRGLTSEADQSQLD
jgi:hypothetical protein